MRERDSICTKPWRIAVERDSVFDSYPSELVPRSVDLEIKAHGSAFLHCGYRVFRKLWLLLLTTLLISEFINSVKKNGFCERT